MKKLNKVAVLFASAALAAPLIAQAQTPTAEQFKYASGADNWLNASGEPWRNGTNELCWRDSNWTPATAYPTCDGALQPPPPPPPAPRVAPPPPPPAAPPAAPPPPAVVPPAAVSEKVTFATDTFFDFDKAVLRPESQAKLTDLVDKTKSVNVEVVIVVGHTDSTGPEGYNQKLSIRRADAVKNFLVEKGVEKNRVYTEGKGETQPVASNSTREGRAKNRRVEVEVVGTRKK